MRNLADAGIVGFFVDDAADAFVLAVVDFFLAAAFLEADLDDLVVRAVVLVVGSLADRFVSFFAVVDLAGTFLVAFFAFGVSKLAFLVDLLAAIVDFTVPLCCVLDFECGR